MFALITEINAWQKIRIEELTCVRFLVFFSITFHGVTLNHIKYSYERFKSSS